MGLRYVAAEEHSPGTSTPDGLSIDSARVTYSERSSLAAGIRTKAAALLIFLLVFIALRQAQPNGIILYQGLTVGLVTCASQYFFERRRRNLVSIQAAKNAVLSFLLIYAFVFTIPTTVDRAYSVNMITRLQEAPSGLTRSEINGVFVDNFVSKGGVEKRLREQASTGSIRENNGRYVLTPFGRFLAATFHMTRILFACGGKR